MVTGTTAIKVGLGVMAMKGYSLRPRSLQLESNYHIQFSVILRTPVFGWGLTPVRRESTVGIFYPLPTGQDFDEIKKVPPTKF